MTLSENERGDSSRRFHSTTHRRPSTPSSNHSIGPMRTRSSHTFASAPPPTTPTQPNTSSTSSSYAYNNVNSNSNSRNRSSVSASRPAVQEVELNQTNSNEFSWPILLAIIPTLGAFFAGSAEIWSDFVMILLILYYVYKWMTGNQKQKNTERASVKGKTKRGVVMDKQQTQTTTYHLMYPSPYCIS